MRRSWMSGLLLLATTAGALAQSWSTAYDQGLTAIKAGNWAQARASFKQAAAYRPEDVSGPTILPGPVSEQRKWRNGAPYSPNFLGAYAGFKQASTLRGDDRTKLLNEIAPEFEALLSKNQYSYETFYFLTSTYTGTNSLDKRMKVDQVYSAAAGKINWKVDTEGITPEDEANVRTTYQQSQQVVQAGGQTVVTPVGTNPVNTVPPSTIGTSLGGRVQTLPSKFALIVGNSTTKLAGQELPFAGDDAQKIREALVMSAGYAEENIELVNNGTAAQIQASVKALASRMVDDATVFVFFAGNGVNIDGKDYLAGVDTAMATDTSSMLAKSEIYQAFMAKGARVFAFFEVNRPMTDGRYFGGEVPLVGRIAQTQATMPGGMIQSYVTNGKTIGIYTDAMAQALSEVHSNQVPILEFGWHVFEKVKRGNTGASGGGSSQTPTLPLLVNLAADARF